MNSTEWLSAYDATKNHFKWFIDQYFPGAFDKIEAMRVKKQWSNMLNSMNNIWFKLPDNKFNIIEKPRGWAQFVHLLENSPKEDGPVNMGIG